MTRLRGTAIGLLMVGVAGLLLAATGCQQSQPRPSAHATSAPAATQPVDAITQNDAQRAAAAIERNQREMSGARQPYERPAEPPVDQPRVGGRR
jgi:hypothetical protein